jgi:hypothetical protein
MRAFDPKPRFLENYAALHDIPRLEEAMTGLLWAIAGSPADFPFIPGSDEIQVGKSDPVPSSDGIAVRLRIWFKAEPEVIRLLIIEAVPEE